MLLIGLSLFFGGWVKGVFGMGLPTVTLGLLSLGMPPVEAAAFIVVPTLATNVWQFAGLIALGAYSVVRASLQIVR